MADRDEHRAAPADVAAEDFLFHLHRGTEMLQDNRVHAAKAELEHALALQPSDPKGQDLLGIVYFRLGLYPRAISIYERLIQLHPDAIEPRINLALCYLKTGQPSQARGELEKVLDQNPRHARAWGYLGLAHQRLGDLERASHAFAAGGHDTMARRLAEMGGVRSGATPPEPPRVLEPTPQAPVVQMPPRAETLPGPPGLPINAPAMMASAPTAAPPGEALLQNALEDEMRRAVGEAAQVLDRGGFQSDRDLPRIPSGTWSAIEPGREPRGPSSAGRRAAISVRDPLEASLRQPPLASEPGPLPPLPPLPPPPPPPPGFGPPRKPSVTALLDLSPGSVVSQPPAGMRGSALVQPSAGEGPPAQAIAPPAARSVPPPPSSIPGIAVRAPETPLAFARERLLVFPRSLPISQHPSGLVLVQAAQGFATRLGPIRALSLGTGTPTQPLRRRSRGRDLDELLGGAEAPIHEIGGRCELVLAPPEGLRLAPLALGDDPLYLREEALIGFELPVSYENGRLPIGNAEAVPMVQLRGRGGVICAVPEHAAAIEIVPGRVTFLVAGAVRGWLGRIVPRALPPSEAPAGLRGAVSFSGEGMVIVDGN